MPSPPKPWERTLPAGHPPTSGGGTCPVSSAAAASLPAPATAAMTSTASSSTPTLPPRPSTLMNATTTALTNNNYGSSYASRYGGYGTTGYGSTGYGTAGYGTTGYGSSYGRYGGMGMGGYGGYGGGYGGYGGMGMGGYGGGMGMGMGGYGGYGMPGQMGGPEDFSLTQQMEAGTQATFQLLQSIVGAFGGFAQMLESTFMATHSSFFAMVGVAEQFGNLRNYFGQILSIFALIRWLKGMVLRLLGRPVPPDLAYPWGPPAGGALTADGFKAFEAGGPTTPNAPRPSKKPIVIFFLTVIGLPYLMNRLVRLITARQEEEVRRRAAAGLPPLMGPNGPLVGPNGMPLIDVNGQPLPISDAAIDPSTLTFVRATHAYSSEEATELSFQVNDVVAVLTPEAERTVPGWWRGRLRDGRIGFIPSTHVAEVPMKKGKGESLILQELGKDTVGKAAAVDGGTKVAQAA